MKAAVIGAGVAGLTCALELADRGFEVEIFESGAGPGAQACSWWAGGMLAPWCERAEAGSLVVEPGVQSIAWWAKHCPGGTVQRGTLVITPPRDRVELEEFAGRTAGFQRLDRAGLAALEPDVAERFDHGLYFPGEAHLDPRQVLGALLVQLGEMRVAVHWGEHCSPARQQALLAQGRRVVNCTGLGAQGELEGLRGVRGEMLLLRSREARLARPVRLLHPRFPVYIVPRGDDVYMVGATVVESDAGGAASVRGLLELLSAACAVHPAFADAEVIASGAGVRPACDDNLPRISEHAGVLHVNGFYRHGFLLAPAYACRLADRLVAEAGAVVRRCSA